MKRLNTKMAAGAAICCMMIVLSGSHAAGATQAGSASASPASNGASNSRSATAKSSKTPAANESDIAAAQASGKVWVNTDTGIYHKSGRWFGKTKSGKFMTESEAKAAGYKAGKN